MKKFPGIFNDVIGPVMRGPSSSHTAASWRIARASMDILNEHLVKALIEFDRDGAWAPNYREQGTCMGIEGGLLGFDMTDEKMKDTARYVKERGIGVEYLVSKFPTKHANTVRLTLWGTSQKKVQIVAVSLGGGAFEIQTVDGKEVAPKVSDRQIQMPFDDLPSLEAYAEKINADLGELGLLYEKCRSGMAEDKLNKEMERLIQIIHQSIDIGLAGTDYQDRILQQQSHLIAEAEKQGKIKGTVVSQIISYVTALMESKSSMELIVALPTAGSCGTVGGVLRAVAEDIDARDKDMTAAYFAAGIIGAYFARGPGFSAEEHGCQVECGAASGMAAAALVQLMGGNAKQALGAASMAIQNMIGLVCDPVADRVEVPCLGKNISAAMNAYSSALMAISGFDAVIPLEQVIHTVSQVSKTMPSCVKCTGKEGLAISEASREIKEKLKTV